MFLSIKLSDFETIDKKLKSGCMLFFMVTVFSTFSYTVHEIKVSISGKAIKSELIFS